MNLTISKKLERLHIPQVIVWLALILTSGFVWLYISKMNPFLISRDQFNFLRIIEAHFTGNLSWHEFFTSHSEHVKPAYLLLFYLNSIFFGMNIKIELFIGLVALCLASITLLKQYQQSIRPQRSEFYISITSLILIAQLFSFNQIASYSFSQLMLGGYLQLFLFLMVFQSADKLWLHKQDGAQLMKLLALIFVTTFSFAGARMPIVVFSVILVPIILFVLDRDNYQRFKKKTAIIVLTSAVVLSGYALLLNVPDKHNDVKILHKLVENPFELWIFASSAITASILPAPSLQSHGWETLHFSLVGTSILAMMLFVVFIYFRQQLYRKSLMPLMMVLYGWGFVAAVTIARYGKGFSIGTALSPRYVFDTQLAGIGIVWMILLWASQGEKITTGKLRFLIAVGVLIIGFQANLAANTWSNAKYSAKAWKNVEELIRSEIDNPNSGQKWPKWYCPSDKICREGAHFLHKHHLNLFRNIEN